MRLGEETATSLQASEPAGGGLATLGEGHQAAPEPLSAESKGGWTPGRPRGLVWRPCWLERRSRQRPAQGGPCAGLRARGGAAALPPSLLGAQPTLPFCSCLWLFLHCPTPPPRGPGTTDQGAGGGLAHLGQDAGFSTGGCQDPEDREEQGEDGQDAIHLGKSEPQ